MSENSEYPIILNTPNGIINCKEVPVSNASYSQLVTSDGAVLVLYAPGSNSAWSACTLSEYSRKIKHQLMFDSRIILYIYSEEYRNLFSNKYRFYSEDSVQHIKYTLLMDSLSISDINYPYITAFLYLQVSLIPRNTFFRIEEYDGNECISINNRGCNFSV
jgi:hypothetical protein